MTSLRRYLKRKPASQKTTFYDYRKGGQPVFCTTNLGDIKEGVSYTISGHMSLVCERFSISLVVDNPTSDIALHISPRLPQNYIVRNSLVNHRWGINEEASVQPFNLRRGMNFTIQILVTNQRYMISINGRHFAMYNHRIPYKNVSKIEVHGDVSNISVNRSEVTEYPEQIQANYICSKLTDKYGLDDLVTVFSRYSINRNFNIGLQLPFYGVLEPHSLGYGKHLLIKGRVKLLPWSFFISLQTGQNVWPHPTVAFHFHCRFAMHRDYMDENVITCSAWFDGKWAREEVTILTTDLSPAKDFTLVIVRKSSSFEVFVNRKIITEYKFLMDPDTVDTVHISGDIKLWNVNFEKHNEGDFTRSNASDSAID